MDTLHIEVGETATVLVAFADKYDRTMAPADASASSDAPTVATAAMAGPGVDVAGMAPGKATVSVGSADVSASFPVEVTAPKAVRVEALVAAATFRKS